MKFFAVLLVLSLTLTASAAENTAPLPLVSIGGNNFSNVVVRDANETSITIVHSRGMASFRTDKLTRADRQQLGLEPPDDTNAPAPATSERVPLNASNTVAALNERLTNMPVAVPGLDAERAEEFLSEFARYSGVAIAAAVALYLFYCFCLLLICRKAGKPAPLLVWIPVAQMFALFRAAKMSPMWFAALVLQTVLQGVLAWALATEISPAARTGLSIAAGVAGLVAFVGWIIWCFKIASARGKSPLTGIALLIPCTHPFALLYLAFSK
jgi:hypothetical protein